MLAVRFAAAAAGGRSVIPATPTLVHHATGQFRITNFDTYATGTTFNLSVTAGTPTRTNDIVALSNANCVLTITATGGGKSVETSSAATAERKAYVCTTTFNYYEHGYINATPGACHGAGAGQCPGGWTVCTDSGGFCGHNDLSATKNATPAGYTDAFNEWAKVS